MNKNVKIKMNALITSNPQQDKSLAAYHITQDCHAQIANAEVLREQ